MKKINDFFIGQKKQPQKDEKNLNLKEKYQKMQF
jgi:hypothetical protein